MSDSKNDKEKKSTEEKQEKVLTKYDLKVKRREEQKAREARNQTIGTVVGVLIVAALVVLVASFPIRSYLTVNGTYLTVDGEKVSKVEFDYYYNISMNSYLSENAYWLSYLGLNLSGDLARQMYSQDMTWQDFFDEMAVNSIAQSKALGKEGKAAGFVYDTAEEYSTYQAQLKRYAAEEGISEKAYIQRLYGVYATESRVKSFVEARMYANAYYGSITDRFLPAQDEIQQYYEENKNQYDSVNYRSLTVEAELPTAPTELADPVGTPTPEATAVPSEDVKYTPSQAEVEAAMAVAKSKAEKQEKAVKTTGDLKEGMGYYAVNSLLREWLFDPERKEGDTTIIENTSGNLYYVLAFEKRYLDDQKAADIRVIMTDGGNGQAIYDEWQSGAATEERFAELCDKYNNPEVMSSEGGLLEGVFSSNLADELKDWIFSSDRIAGDVALIAPEGNANEYVIYYVSPDREEWILDIEGILQAQRAEEYLDELTGSIKVEDKKGNLNYLKVYEARAKAEAEKTPEPESGAATEEPAAE